MSSNSPEISIIVPVFNGEGFIGECLDKLSGIDGLSCEIIVVDDGSSDQTRKIVNEYKNVTTIRNEHNEGVSNARNKGIEKASGKYIAFVDVDDEFDVGAYKKLVSMAESHNLDVVVGDYYEVFNGKRNSSKYNYETENITGDEATRLYLLDKISNNVWDKIFKKDLVKNIEFDHNLAIGEDILFCLRAFMVARKVGFIKDEWYGYSQNNNSAMHSQIDAFRQYNQVLESLSAKDAQVLQEKYPSEFKFFRLEMETRTIHAISMSNASREKKEMALRGALKDFRMSEIVDEKDFPKSIRIEMFLLKTFGPKFHLTMMPVYRKIRSFVR